MRHFLDTEFDGFGGRLISLALVRVDGRSLYAVLDGAEDAADPWVRANVLPILYRQPVLGSPVDAAVLAQWLGDFLNQDPDGAPVIVADWPDDIGYFCKALITGPGLMVKSPPRLTFQVERVDAYPTMLADAVQHNAFWDAQALRHKLAPETFK